MRTLYPVEAERVAHASHRTKLRDEIQLGGHGPRLYRQAADG